MSSSTLAILHADARDRRYHVIAKTLLGLPLIVYVVAFFLLPHTVTTQPSNNNNNNITVLVAKDGLKMSVATDMPEWKLYLHSFSAMALLLGCVFQKENVVWMSTAAQYVRHINLHRWVGRACLLCIAGMDAGGLLMGQHSSLDKFQLFVVFFAIPFAVFGIGLYVTARPTMLEYHRLFANMLLKGCIGTPLARLGGSLLQRFDQHFTLSTGYYTGIGGVTVLLGAWQLVELVEFWYRMMYQNQKQQEMKKVE